VRANKIRDRGTVSHRHDANALLQQPGDTVLVFRGVFRSLVMACPDGCGEVLTINLDARTDKAWRYYIRRNQISLFPSVWRDTGCGSHFILWNQLIIWCDATGWGKKVEVEDGASLRSRVLQKILFTWVHYTEIAQSLDEVPWDVEWVCSDLVRKGRVLEEGVGKMRGYFRKIP
jgi:Family of unknown function (DUF6527)